MHVLSVMLVLSAVLTGEAGSFDGGETEGLPGADEGFVTAVDLPLLAYPAISALALLTLLAITFAFRSANKRH